MKNRKDLRQLKINLGVGLGAFFLSLGILFSSSNYNNQNKIVNPYHASNGTATVSTYADLTTALNDDDISTITLANAITLPDGANINGDLNETGTRKTIKAEVTGTNDQGAINSNASSYSLFYVEKDATVKIENVNLLGGGNTAIVNGASNTSTNNNSTLYLDHVTISNSGSKSSVGGALLNTQDSTVVLTKSTLLRNIANYGGGFDNKQGTVIVEDCSILENRSYAAGGGGIENTGDNSSSKSSSGEAILYMSNTTVANNASQEIGGGINNCKYGYAYIANSTIACNATTNTFNYESVGGGIGNNNAYLTIVNSLVAGNVQLNTSDDEVVSSDISSYTSNGSIEIVGSIYGNVEDNDADVNVDSSCYQVADNDSLFLSSTENCIISENGTNDSIYYTQSTLVADSDGVLYAPLATESVAVASNGYVKLAKVNFDYSDLSNIVFNYNFDEETTDTVAGSNLGSEEVSESQEIVNVKVNSNSDFEITGGTIYGDSYLVCESGQTITLQADSDSISDKQIMWFTLKNGDYQLLSSENPYIFNTNDEPFKANSHDSFTWDANHNCYKINIYPVTFGAGAVASDKEVTLSWNPESNTILSSVFDSYDIYYSTINNFENSTYLNYFGNTSDDSVSVTGLTNGQTYYFWIVPVINGSRQTTLKCSTYATPSNDEAVWTLASSLTSGKEYIITNSNSVTTSAKALTTGSSSGSITNVEIKDNNGTKYIESTDSNIMWTATASGSYFKLKSGSYYISLSSNPLSTNSKNLTYSSNQLYYSSRGSKKYLSLNGTTPSVSTSSQNVYVYEKTLLTSQETPTSISVTSQQWIGIDSGTISGINTSMEYSTDGLNWTDVSSTSMNNVACGNYYFRYKATLTSYASPSVMITIKEKKVESLKVKAQPRLSYIEGEELDLSTLIVTVYYNDGSFINVPYDVFTSTSKTDYDRASGVITTSISNGSTITRSKNKYTVNITLDGVSVSTNPLIVDHYLEHVEYKEATCEEDGNLEYWVCRECGEIFLDEDGTISATSDDIIIEATGHNYSDEIIDPTCTEEGYTTHICSDCGDTYSDNYTDPTGHDYEITDSQEATCEEDGYITYTCTHCGKSYTEVIEATGHNYVVTVSDPTCTTEGYTTHTCTTCGHTYTDTYTDALGHDYEIADSKEATCEEDGYITYTCTHCGKSYTEVIEATGHNYIDTVTDPTCTAEGYTTHTCITCGHSYTDSYTDALGHDYEITESQDATCEEDGYITYTCTHCGHSYTEIISKTGHDYEEVVTSPTCENEGYITHICTHCGDSYVDSYTEATGHDYEITNSQEATCEEDGYITYTCTHCGKSYTEVIEATGHNYVDTVTDPTCTTEGYTTHTCTTCGHTYTDSYTDALGHDYEITSSEEATCEDDGYITYTCTHCGMSYTDVIEASGHNYTENVIDPTCTEQGFTTHTCTTCGHSYKDSYTDSLGHDYEITSSQGATCEEDGYITYTCTHCGHSYTETISKTGHDYEEVVTTPTCENEGYTTHICTHCGDSYVDSYTEATGHDYEMISSQEATCEEDGYITYTCTHCGKSYTEVIEATGHNYSDEIIDPTCTEEGYTTHTCTTCGHTYTDSYSDALGHDYEITDSQEATCEEDGYITYTCTHCGHSYTETISKTGHDYEEVVTSPTCESEGYTTHICTHCGDSYVDSYTEAIGHDYEIANSQEATCEEDGYITYTCTHCGKSYTDVIEATGHSYVDTVTDPTCTTEGYTTHTCTTCGHTYTDSYTVASGHDYEITDSQEATCEEDGYITYTCTNCGHSYTEIISKIGHDYEEIVTSPTCENEGYTTHICTHCGDSYVDSYTEATGHDYEITSSHEATCEEDGFITYTCTHCGKSYTEVIETSGHNYVDTVTDPTCTTEGYTTHTCTTCGHTYTDSYTVASGHDYEITDSQEATCEEDGYITYTCTRCGKSHTDLIEATGHNYTENVTNSTCTEQGYTTHTCTNCGHSYVDSYTDALGHDYQLTNSKEAGCEENGYNVYTCSHCGDGYEETIDAHGHNYVVTKNVAPTRNSDGYIEETCTHCHHVRTTVIPKITDDTNTKGSSNNTAALSPVTTALIVASCVVLPIAGIIVFLIIKNRKKDSQVKTTNFNWKKKK